MDYSTRTLDDFLENVALVSDQDTIKEEINAPTLLTLHAAKGLEFGAVFITGLDDGILPHSRSFDEPEQMEEEFGPAEPISRGRDAKEDIERQVAGAKARK